MTLFNLQNQLTVKLLALITMLVMVASLVPASVLAQTEGETSADEPAEQPVVDPVPAADLIELPAEEGKTFFETASSLVEDVVALVIAPCSPQTSVTGPTNIQNTDTLDYFNTVNDALADCDTEDGDTITLSNNISITQQITIGRPITIDGNGFTVSPTFARTDSSNNSSIGILDTEDVIVKDLVIEGIGGTNLHGFNVYRSTNVDILDVTVNNPKRTGVVVNGSEVMVNNLKTSGSMWHAINAAPGSGVTTPTILTVNGVSVHAESAPTPHIFTDDTSKDVTINDTNSQYEVVYNGPNPQNIQVTAKSLRLKVKPTTVKVHIYKYLQEGEVSAQIPNTSTAPNFPMISSWDAENLGGPGSGNYVLGNNEGGTVLRYAADTSFMSVPADYTTSEVTGGESVVLPADAQCVPGKYRLVGYKKGDTLEAAENASVSTTAPAYTDITADKYIIVVNEECDDAPKPVCEIGKNLLQNGSFEMTPVVTDNGGQWQIFTAISNWFTGLSDGIEVWNTFNGVSDDVASDGQQNVELDGNNATRLTQSATTIPGATYELKFDFSPRATIGAADNVMAVLVDGATVDTVNGDGTGTTTNAWVPKSKTFVAASTSTEIGFEDKGIANDDGGFGPLLDNVALCLVKEPEPLPTCSLTIKSDATDYVVEKNAMAKLMSYIHPSWVTSIGTSTAAWIWGDNPVVNPLVNETQTFKKSFNWTGGTVTGATLKLASDNSHEVKLGAYTNGNPGEFNYGAVTSYDVATSVVNGLNTLAIEVENFAQVNGTQTSNPAGLMYELTITGTGESCGTIIPEVPKTTGAVTMCKVDENNLPLAGWTMTLLGDEVESVTVPAGTAAGVNTTAMLDAGKSYVAVAQGTWNNNRGPLNIVDAEYSTEDNWATQLDGFTASPTDILELSINNVLDPQSKWGPYNSDHTYAQMFTQAATGTAKFHIADTFYGDNTGSLNVSVFEGYAGITGENGCVTFSNVPFGTYDADEILKAGWTQISGAGSTTVSYENTPKTITIKNDKKDIVVDPDPETYTLDGYKYECVEDGDYICNEPKAGWTIYATMGLTTLSTTTDENGYYYFEVEEGDWTVSEDSEDSDWTQVYIAQRGTELFETDSCNFEVEDETLLDRARKMISKYSQYQCDFGNYYEEDGDETPRNYSIAGFKWSDVDGDGVKDEDEAKLPNWVITATNGETSFATTTNANGDYTLTLPYGNANWTVSETLQTGWTQTGLYSNGTKVTLGGDISNNCMFTLGANASTSATCDFGNKQNTVVTPDPETPNPTNRSGGGGSGTRVTNRATPQGLVLGAATGTPACGMYLQDYMRVGNAASTTQVTKLQVFLNAVGITAPLTGVFDAATDAAVRAFQMQYKPEVLTPWYLAKLVPHENSTGWVYQLTRWKINNIVCPGSEAYPVLN